MKTKNKILIGITVLAVCAVVLLLAVIVAIGPTQGKKIEKYEKPQKALLIIDVQEDYTGSTAKPPFPYKDSGRLITTVNNLINEANKKNIFVIYIKQEFDGILGRTISKIFAGGTAMKGNAGAEIDKRVSIISNNIFSRPAGDAFSNPKFESFLINHQVDAPALMPNTVFILRQKEP